MGGEKELVSSNGSGLVRMSLKDGGDDVFGFNLLDKSV